MMQHDVIGNYRECPSCNTKLPLNAKFCAVCGTRLMPLQVGSQDMFASPDTPWKTMQSMPKQEPQGEPQDAFASLDTPSWQTPQNVPQQEPQGGPQDAFASLGTPSWQTPQNVPQQKPQEIQNNALNSSEPTSKPQQESKTGDLQNTLTAFNESQQEPQAQSSNAFSPFANQRLESESFVQNGAAPRTANESEKSSAGQSAFAPFGSSQSALSNNQEPQNTFAPFCPMPQNQEAVPSQNAFAPFSGIPQNPQNRNYPPNIPQTEANVSPSFTSRRSNRHLVQRTKRVFKPASTDAPEEIVAPEDVMFAKGLPEWSIEPPVIPVRRKRHG